jgi:hypothetical protein
VQVLLEPRRLAQGPERATEQVEAVPPVSVRPEEVALEDRLWAWATVREVQPEEVNPVWVKVHPFSWIFSLCADPLDSPRP